MEWREQLQRDVLRALTKNDPRADVVRSAQAALLARPAEWEAIEHTVLWAAGAWKSPQIKESLWEASRGALGFLVFVPAMGDALRGGQWSSGPRNCYRHPSFRPYGDPPIGRALDRLVAGIARRGELVVGNREIPRITDPANPFHGIWRLNSKWSPEFQKDVDPNDPGAIVLDLIRRQAMEVVDPMRKVLHLVRTELGPITREHLEAVLLFNRRMLEPVASYPPDEVGGRLELPTEQGERWRAEHEDEIKAGAVRFRAVFGSRARQMPLLGYSGMSTPSDSGTPCALAHRVEIHDLLVESVGDADGDGPAFVVYEVLAASVVERNKALAASGLPGGTLSISGMEALAVIAGSQALDDLLRDPELAPLVEGVEAAGDGFSLSVQLPTGSGA